MTLPVWRGRSFDFAQDKLSPAKGFHSDSEDIGWRSARSATLRAGFQRCDNAPSRSTGWLKAIP
jgi:hypothetical protein